MGIFAALAEKLEKDGWMPPPGWWLQKTGTTDVEAWLNLSQEQKLGAWIAATDYDYIELAQHLLGRTLKKEQTDEQRSRTAGSDDRPDEGVEFHHPYQRDNDGRR